MAGPSIGPILGSIITLSASEATISKGVLLLTFYSMGLAIPFVLSGYFMTIFLNSKKVFQNIMERLQKLRIYIIINSVLILTNQIQVISYYILTTFPILAKFG